MYAFQKIHCSANMIRDSKDIRADLARAFSMELQLISEADFPAGFEERLHGLVHSLTLPEEIEMIEGIGRAQAAVNSLSDQEVERIKCEILSHENELRPEA